MRTVLKWFPDCCPVSSLTKRQKATDRAVKYRVADIATRDDIYEMLRVPRVMRTRDSLIQYPCYPRPCRCYPRGRMQILYLRDVFSF